MPKKKQKVSPSQEQNETLHEKSKMVIHTKEIAYEEIALILSEFWQAMDSYHADPHRHSQKRFPTS